MLLGIGEAIYLPGGSKIVSLLFPPAERGLPSGLFDAGTRTGLVIEGVLVPWMLIHYGWRTTFIVVGFAALLWLLAVVPDHAEATRARERRPAASRPPGFGQRSARWSPTAICSASASRFFCFDYYWYFLVNWLPDYLVTSRGLTF